MRTQVDDSMIALCRLAAMLFLVAQLALPSPVCANGALMRGIEAYQKKDYARAQTLLREAIRSAPEDSVAHYYLGNTMLKLKNSAGAENEFKLANENAETDDIRENSKSAMQKLKIPQKGKTLPSATNSINVDSLPLSADEKKSVSPYLKQNGEIDQAKSTSMMKDLLPADLKNKAQNMDAHDPALPGLLSDFLGQTQFGSAMSAGERKSFIEDELRRRNMSMESVLQMFKGNSAVHSQNKAGAAQEERAKVLKEIQENLDDQMNSKVGNSSVQLKPEGTSIYVRNYEHH